MSENKFTSRQFLMSFFWLGIVMGFAWSTLGKVSEDLTRVCLYLGAVDVLFFCFNDLAKKLIEKIDLLRGFIHKPETTEGG